MKILTASLSALVLAASFATAHAEEADRASAPSTVYLQSIGQAPATAVGPVIESRQSAAVVSGNALSERDRFLIDHTDLVGGGN